ncbi:AzlD domain-containing protein [Marinobacter sp. S0848L]|uniref:AzlD family protein n=1 Tax=Marinobacter sp. S0848L TaxID=2926423 RepID=UPI001FF1E2C1|nr:AzlD domain-containing protein [Marinobacter sp. S0848L]MCK0104742.1 AzlD domain-containing protein [Marinobacter sp. S0848L]
MTIETTPVGVLILIVLMTLVTLITRFGGVFAMSFVKISPRVESFINAMASSVLIAIIVPMAVAGDAGALAALVATAITMLAIRKPLPAISVGLVAAALVRYLG